MNLLHKLFDQQMSLPLGAVTWPPLQCHQYLHMQKGPEVTHCNININICTVICSGKVRYNHDWDQFCKSYYSWNPADTPLERTGHWDTNNWVWNTKLILRSAVLTRGSRAPPTTALTLPSLRSNFLMDELSESAMKSSVLSGREQQVSPDGCANPARAG